MKNIDTMSPRIFISFYFSLILHFSIFLLAIYPFNYAMQLICGIDEPVLVKEELKELMNNSQDLDFL